MQKNEYASALEAMLESGVQVYFVDDEIMERLNNAEDGGLSILHTLQSENQLWDFNVRSLPEAKKF